MSVRLKLTAVVGAAVSLFALMQVLARLGPDLTLPA